MFETYSLHGQAQFSIDRTPILILTHDLFAHYVVVGLRDDSDQEVQKDDQDHVLVHDPDNPNAIYH